MRLDAVLLRVVGRVGVVPGFGAQHFGLDVGLAKDRVDGAISSEVRILGVP